VSKILTFPSNEKYSIRNVNTEDFESIQSLCLKVYPFSKPWSIQQLSSHQLYFPEGQLIAVEKSTNKLVGLAFGLIIQWNDYSPQDSWGDFTSGGFFHNHSPQKGKTLYGAEVMVDPDYRGQGIGKLLYQARIQLAEHFNLKRIRAGARLRGYSRHSEEMTADEYAKKIVRKELFDPTLSFQLGQDFVVIGVAKNYLFNDPESLGFAAVIEWINPKSATPRDISAHRRAVESFLSSSHIPLESLPKELRRTVRLMMLLLGKVIKEYEGEQFFDWVEHVRTDLKRARTGSATKLLSKLTQEFKDKKHNDLLKLCHAFSLLMEIINVCEGSYRTWRQRHKQIHKTYPLQTVLTFVLTAHPTEARSIHVIDILKELGEVVVNGIQNQFVFEEAHIRTLLRLLWTQPLAKSQRPTVSDEAEHIAFIVLQSDILDYILMPKKSFQIRLRTWVGGDKDGHPGVDDAAMLLSLSKSRKQIVSALRYKMSDLIDDYGRFPLPSTTPAELRKLTALKARLKDFEKVSPSSERRLQSWRKEFIHLCNRGSKLLKHHHQAYLIQNLFVVFPALVIPLELREDSAEILKSLTDKRHPIRQMLHTLASISQGANVTSYARGLVISHCESAADLRHAEELIVKVFGKAQLPVVPLFESEAALVSAPNILKEWLSEDQRAQEIQENFQGRFEIMLGYSDSAKEVGILSSRTLIRNCMAKSEKALKKFGLNPIYFHGSGGSVARGGGSFKEQIAWWPTSALKAPKLTVQGEMIQRLFSSPELLSSQCFHLTHEAISRRTTKHKYQKNEALDRLTELVKNEYRTLVENKTLMAELLKATPYDYLSVLKIGSRPSKRKEGEFSLSSLRAIPWVMCWTQSRILWPTWWGIGSAWEKLNPQEQESLKTYYETDPFFSSFVKTLGFTLAKVEIDVFEMYLSEGYTRDCEPTIRAFRHEYEKSLRFVRKITGQNNLLSHKLWLQESIRLRSPYIHVINVIQQIAMNRRDEELLRESIVGIACGMLTTG